MDFLGFLTNWEFWAGFWSVAVPCAVGLGAWIFKDEIKLQKRLKAQADTIENKFDALESKYHILLDNYNGLVDMASQKDSMLKSTQALMVIVQSELTRTVTNNDVLQTKLEKFRSMEKENVALRIENGTLREQIKAQEEQIKAQEEQINTLRERLTQLENKVGGRRKDDE